MSLLWAVSLNEREKNKMKNYCSNCGREIMPNEHLFEGDLCYDCWVGLEALRKGNKIFWLSLRIQWDANSIDYMGA